MPALSKQPLIHVQETVAVQPDRSAFWKVISDPRVILFGILLTALTVRLGYAIYKPPLLHSDSGTYHLIAKSLIAGNGYSEDGVHPSRVRPPTYPTFLALVYLLTGPSPKAAVAAQAVAGTFTALFVYLLAGRIFDRRTGLLAALIVALYPALVYYDNRILREGFTAMLLTATVLLSIRTVSARRKTGRLLALGLLLAALSMCRPETILLTGPIGYLLVRPVRRLRALWKPALLVALPILLVWVPWTVRNYVTFGSLSPVTAGLGSVLWFGSRWADMGGEDRADADLTEIQEQTYQIWYENLTTNNEANIEHTFMKMAVQDILQNPVWFVQMIFKKIYLFWKDANGVKKTLPAIHPLLANLVNIYYYLLLILAGVGVVACMGKREWVLPLAGVVVTYMVTYALLHVRNRYRVPVLPLVFILSAGGFWAVYDLVKAYLGEGSE